MGVAAKILAEQLHHYGDGHALWNPSPRDGQELSIGDVGFIDQEGTFTRFFNVMENLVFRKGEIMVCSSVSLCD